MQQPKFFGDIGHVTQRNIVHVTQRSHPFVFVFLAQVGEGGYSQKNLVGVCGPLPKTLTLFMTKICDFPYPIYDQTKNFIPYL